jgi:hypothetical protein
VITSALRKLLVGCFILGTVVYASAACEAPSYRKAKVWEESKAEIMMDVSIDLSDFAPDRLVCLAEAIRQTYKEHDEVDVYIFSSYEAAERYFPAGTVDVDFGSDLSRWESEFHAYYYYNSREQRGFIDLMPVGGVKGSAFGGRIDLPVSGRPQCGVQINGRCLIALSDIEYPPKALHASVSGEVTLTGRVDRNGFIHEVSLAKSVASGGRKGRRALETESFQNLSTWHFAMADREDIIRITFSYIIDRSYAFSGQTELTFTPPDQVVMKGKP